MTAGTSEVRTAGRPGTAVTDEEIEEIEAMIVSGALRPGDRLPGESEPAAGPGLFGNSPREAVRALSLIRTLCEHRAILAAPRDRDAEAARSRATVHLASVEQ